MVFPDDEGGGKRQPWGNENEEGGLTIYSLLLSISATWRSFEGNLKEKER
jgi:hypothetical protein